MIAFSTLFLQHKDEFKEKFSVFLVSEPENST